MPLVRHDKTPLLGIWEIAESWQEMLIALKNKDVYAADLHKIQSDKRKQEWIAVRLLLQQLARARTFIIYGQNGAPFLSDGSYNISIAHTKGFAAILLSKHNKPGIDIEYRSERAWKLRKKFLNKNEWTNHVLNATDYATVCWCAKETAFKALGETAIDFAEHLIIEPFHLSTEGILFLQETRTRQQQRFTIRYEVNEPFILTWKE